MKLSLNLNKLPWYAQLGAFAAIAIAGVGGFYYQYVTGVETEMASRQTQLDKLRGDINKGLSTARKLPEFQAEIADLERRLEELRAVLPEQKDVGDLLRRIQTLAMQSNLTITSFKPQPIVTKQLHAEWPITLELEGTYHNLGLFFDKISKFSRIINISNIKITAREKTDQRVSITAQCMATTFVLLESAAAKPGTPPAAAPAPAGKAGK